MRVIKIMIIKINNELLCGDGDGGGGGGGDCMCVGGLFVSVCPYV